MRDGVRWIADVTYRSNAGPFDVRFHMAELHEIHDLVERGPNFYCIEKIEITLALNSGEQVKTLEDAERE